MAADLEKGDSSASPSAGGGGAVAGSVGLEYIIPAIIAAICFIGWVCANLQLQSSSSGTATQVISFSVAPLIFQATTFAVAATLAWYASSYGNATYALLASIFNWIVVCCWLIYIEPNYGFFFWKTSFIPNSAVTFDCFSNTLDTNSCNSYKASSIFSIFIVTINFAWFVIYLMKGISAIRFSAGLKSIFTILGFLNLLGYLLWLAGQLRMTDKFSATTDAVTGGAMSYIITFMVGACTLLMFATANDEMGGSLNALNLIWHPLTAAIIWSNVISFARATDGKYGNTNVKDDAGKTIAAGIFMMAVAETVASILSLVSKFL